MSNYDFRNFIKVFLLFFFFLFFFFFFFFFFLLLLPSSIPLLISIWAHDKARSIFKIHIHVFSINFPSSRQPVSISFCFPVQVTLLREITPYRLLLVLQHFLCNKGCDAVRMTCSCVRSVLAVASSYSQAVDGPIAVALCIASCE